MALSDAQIFAAVIPLLGIRNTEDLIAALQPLDDESFSRAFDLHALITYRLDREESREATQRWMDEVGYDTWPEPSAEEREYIRRLDVMHERMGQSHGGIDIWDSVEQKMQQIENRLLADNLFGKVTRHRKE